MNIYSYIIIMNYFKAGTLPMKTKEREAQEREEMLQSLVQALPEQELLYELAELFKIFGDSTRIQILSLLQKTELCVSEISQILKLSPSATSHQLRILRQARLVRYCKVGKVVFYSLDDEHIERIFEQGLEHIMEL